MNDIQCSDLDATVASSFNLAEQGTLQLVDLMTTADKFKAAGLTDKAVALYRLWLEHSSSPLAYVACFNLGVELAAAREYAEAEDMYRKALEQNPALLQARLNLGNSLEQQGREDEALEQWRTALTAKNIDSPENRPFQLHALNNLGRLLETKRNFLEALTVLEKSFAIDATQKDVLLHLVHLTQKMCRWPVYDPPKGISKTEMIKGTSPLAMLAAFDDPALQLSAAKQFVEHKYPADNAPLAPAAGYRHDKTRIGYLSSDLSMHAVSLLTVELFEKHDRERFEVYGFCWSREDGTAFRNRVTSAMDHFIRIGSMSDREAAECIRSHEIDILVDLHGLTSGARPLILSYRPALAQVTYLGFPGTTALPWIDHVVADRYLIPEDAAGFYTEKPLYLPHCFQVSDSKREVGSRPSRADYDLPESGFVFCSFNNNYKYTPELFAVWMGALKQVPGSVLWLLADNEWAKENLYKTARKHGIKKDRLIFAPRVAPADYLARYQLADLFLDTFPFNGGTTANDALFMGLPLLTMSGRCFASRMAGSLLTALGLPELIATNLKEYAAKAVRLAKNHGELKKIKKRLQESKTSSTLFDTQSFVKQYESALLAMLQDKHKELNDEIGRVNLAASTPPEPAATTLPLVSILIPSYKPKHFEFALLSAIGQSYENIEIVVSDDCPNEGIKEIVDRYRQVREIRYERNPKPDGYGIGNITNCLHLAKGEYIKFLFDDDVLMPFCVQYMMDAFLTNAAVNPRLVMSQRWYIDGDNRYTGAAQLPLSGLSDITDTYVERYLALNRGNPLGEFTTAMWKHEDSFDSDGRPLMFKIDDTEILGLVDVAMFINLSRRGRVLYISLPLSCFRRHGGANSAAVQSHWFYRIFTDWEIIIDQALARNLVTMEEALASLEALERENRMREPLVESLKGHPDRLAKKIARMRGALEAPPLDDDRYSAVALNG